MEEDRQRRGTGGMVGIGGGEVKDEKGVRWATGEKMEEGSGGSGEEWWWEEEEGWGRGVGGRGEWNGRKSSGEEVWEGRGGERGE